MWYILILLQIMDFRDFQNFLSPWNLQEETNIILKQILCLFSHNIFNIYPCRQSCNKNKLTPIHVLFAELIVTYFGKITWLFHCIPKWCIYLYHTIYLHHIILLRRLSYEVLNFCAEYLPPAYRSRQAVHKAKLNSPYSTNMKINIAYFDNMVSQIYPSELQLNNANASDTADLHLSISNDICPFLMILFLPKLVSEYDQEIPQ